MVSIEELIKNKFQKTCQGNKLCYFIDMKNLKLSKRFQRVNNKARSHESKEYSKSKCLMQMYKVKIPLYNIIVNI